MKKISNHIAIRHYEDNPVHNYKKIKLRASSSIFENDKLNSTHDILFQICLISTHSDTRRNLNEIT